jgi:hypothetical protein
MLKPPAFFEICLKIKIKLLIGAGSISTQASSGPKPASEEDIGYSSPSIKRNI